ncbi:MAG TPA: class I tRNA ligase family protein, partial [Candidatus Pacearchaeota archaeon]|nr:class I tRNA ligase family protein [Candidatus Pacearchaeota archaeon]
DWEKFWKDEKSEVYNFLGKDNIPFHTIFWPGMVIANGEFNLPKNVVGLQYLNYEGQKFSKSKGIGVFCERLPELKLEADVWRHYLTQIIPETSDSEFRWKDFQERVNSDLIGNYANYVNRVLNFIYTKLDRKITKPASKELQEIDKNLLKKIEEKRKSIGDLMERAELRKAYAEILELSSEGNKYINDSEPWNVIKENPKRANNIFYISAFLLKNLAILFAPYLPKTSEKVWKQLNLKGSPSCSGVWEEAEKDFGKEHEINKPELIFKKIEDKEIEEYRKITSQGIDLTELFK